MQTSDGRRLRGHRTRETVLDAAIATASTAGLEGSSLAKLASGLGISKSALFTHWPDKQSLQLAVIDAAAAQWAERVVAPALRDRHGLAALWALQESRLAFYAEPVLPGRCFFVTAYAEFDDRPGPVHDRLRELLEGWEALQVGMIRDAIDAGELRADTAAEVLAFELDALGSAVVTRARLLDTATTFAHARAALLARLRAAATDPALLPQR